MKCVVKPYKISGPRATTERWRVRSVTDSRRANYGEGCDTSPPLAQSKAVADFATRQLGWTAYSFKREADGTITITKLKEEAR